MAPQLTERVLAFRTCPQCEYDLTTGEGTRSCHYYECPYLPDALNTVCPQCYYNFFTPEGEPPSGEHPGCNYVVEDAAERVLNLRAWLAAHMVPAG
jgi:hypothetical protein